MRLHPLQRRLDRRRAGAIERARHHPRTNAVLFLQLAPFRIGQPRDRARRVMHSLHGGAAEAVHGHARDFLGQARQQHDVARHVEALLAFGEGVAKLQVFDQLRVHAGFLDEACNHLRDDFIRDSVSGVGRWNKVIEKAGIPFRLTVPHKAFNRQIGTLAGVRVSPQGEVLSDAQWKAHVDNWLPTPEDRAFVASLMGRVVEPGKFANWIAPPVMGINRNPVQFEYVRFN